jgi:CRP-like cAMP-binding protein
MVALHLNRETFPIRPSTFKGVPNLSSPFEAVPEIAMKRGQIIFTGNDAHLHVYMVTKGIVKLCSFHDGKEMMEDYFQKGEMFNGEALFNRDRDGLTAEAMTPMTIIKKVPVRAFRYSMKVNPALYEEVISNISGSLNRTQERLRRMTLLGSEQRVVHFLVNLTLKSGRRAGYEWVVQPTLTHREMACIAGTGRQTMTTTLNELRRDRIIHFTRKYLIVRDMDALRGLLS